MNASDTQTFARIHEEAASWLEKIERTISPEEGQALRVWLKAASHREAIVERCKRWHGPEILAVLGELIPVESFHEKAERHYGRMLLAVILGVIALGTMTVMITAARFFPGTDARGNPLRAESVHHTGVGERKTLNLPDGGSIVLNTSSRVRLVYRPRYRDASLMAGEAMFEVKYDPARPFVVAAGTRAFEVEAGGARFNLRKLTEGEVQLTVLEGRVRANATRLDSASPALRRAGVTYGEHVFSASEGGTVALGWQTPWRLTPEEIERRLAWQTGRVIFQDELLEHALREVERYTLHKFVFASDELRKARLSGVFRVGEVEALRRYLLEHLGIESEVSPAATIVLMRRLAPPSDTPVSTYMDCLANDSCRRLNDGAHVAL